MMKWEGGVPPDYIEHIVAALPSIRDPDVIMALRQVGREWFMPRENQDRCYVMERSHCLGERWPHPAVLAFMLQALKHKREDRVLVIGSCGGYLAALLVSLGVRPFVLEATEAANAFADAALQKWCSERQAAAPESRGAQFVMCPVGGMGGYAAHAPFDGILSSFAFPGVPYPLVAQLRLQGRFVGGSFPVAGDHPRALENLVLIEKVSEEEVRADGNYVFPRIRLADLLSVELDRWPPALQPPSDAGICVETSNDKQGKAVGERTSGRGTGRTGYTTAEVLQKFSAGPQSGVFTDGSANPNPGPGGWGYVHVQNGTIVSEKCGHDADTTNNRMELTALIEAYRSLPLDATISVYSDSNLCVQTINQWARSWERNGWKRKTGPIANLELVQELYAEAKKRPGVKLQWIEAHNGWKWNEYADALSTSWQR